MTPDEQKLADDAKATVLILWEKIKNVYIKVSPVVIGGLVVALCLLVYSERKAKQADEAVKKKYESLLISQKSELESATKRSMADHADSLRAQRKFEVSEAKYHAIQVSFSNAVDVFTCVSNFRASTGIDARIIKLPK